jgi:hypothetical protein
MTPVSPRLSGSWKRDFRKLRLLRLQFIHRLDSVALMGGTYYESRSDRPTRRGPVRQDKRTPAAKAQLICGVKGTAEAVRLTKNHFFSDV